MKIFPSPTRGRQGVVKYPPLPSRASGLSVVGVAVRVILREAVCVLLVLSLLLVGQAQLADEGEEEEEEAAEIISLHSDPELTCN